MKTLKIKILSWLLYQANTLGKDEFFYKIKNMVLKKYGCHTGYDIQFIDGKKCHSCGGSGVFVHYSGDRDYCWHCENGWHKKPMWVTLSRIKFGKYTFHQPIAKVFQEPDIQLGMKIIEGYIDHDRAEYGEYAKAILSMLYDFKGFWVRYWNGVNGIRCYWYWPRNWFRTLLYLIKYRGKGFKFLYVVTESEVKAKFNSQIRVRHMVEFDYSNEDLPF